MVLFLRCQPLGFGSVALHEKGPRGSAAAVGSLQGAPPVWPAAESWAREGDRDKPEAKREYRNEQQSKKAEREAFSLRSGTINSNARSRGNCGNQIWRVSLAQRNTPAQSGGRAKILER